MRKLIVFGTYHQVQGVAGFGGTIDDPDYRTLLEGLMQLQEVKFIFEEVGGLGPSVASRVAAVAGVPYLDMDFENTAEALANFRERQEEMFSPQIEGRPKLQHPAYKLGITIQNWRESCWVSHIKDQEFRTGLVICGMAHSLSVAFRLQAEGFDVQFYTYEPIERLCLSYGMRPPEKPGGHDVKKACGDV